MALLVASLIVSFIAGTIALAMPCCFSVLLPSYFGSAFRRRSAILGMTLVFGAGIATVVLPIALAANTLGTFFGQQHKAIFAAGGFLMILLGMLSLWGKGIMPQLNLPVDLSKTSVASVYTLGVMGGIATSCCAPVLAGLAVLSVLASSMLATVLIGVAYVAGMLAPLVVAALVWDKRATKPNSLLSGKLLRFQLAGRPVAIHSSNLIAGLMFILMGAVTVGLGVTGTMVTMPGTVAVGVFQAKVEARLSEWAATPVGGAVGWATLVALLLAAGIVLQRARKQRLAMRRVEAQDHAQDHAPDGRG